MGISHKVTSWSHRAIVTFLLVSLFSLLCNAFTTSSTRVANRSNMKAPLFSTAGLVPLMQTHRVCSLRLTQFRRSSSSFSSASDTSSSAKDSNNADSSASEVQNSNPESSEAFIMRGHKRRTKTSADMRFEMLPIGVVQSPYETKFGVPKQATITARDDTRTADGKLQFFPPYHKCITSLEGFDYIWVITLMHLNSGFKTLIKPMPVADAERQPPKEVGLFASRAPHRPNPIALSALRVMSVNVDEGWIEVRGLDLLNDTPILDVKPYIPAFDSFPEAKAGWMDMIRSDANEARLKGYQTIHSKRGARASRAGERLRRQQLDANHTSENSTNSDSNGVKQTTETTPTELL